MVIYVFAGPNGSEKVYINKVINDAINNLKRKKISE